MFILPHSSIFNYVGVNDHINIQQSNDNTEANELLSKEMNISCDNNCNTSRAPILIFDQLEDKIFFVCKAVGGAVTTSAVHWHVCAWVT
jgi:hypothetical protein